MEGKLEQLEATIRRMKVDIELLNARADLAETMLFAEQLRRGIKSEELHGFMQRLLNAAKAAGIASAQRVDDQSVVATAAEQIARSFSAAYSVHPRNHLWVRPTVSPNEAAPRTTRTPGQA